MFHANEGSTSSTLDSTASDGTVGESGTLCGIIRKSSFKETRRKGHFYMKKARRLNEVCASGGKEAHRICEINNAFIFCLVRTCMIFYPFL